MKSRGPSTGLGVTKQYFFRFQWDVNVTMMPRLKNKCEHFIGKMTEHKLFVHTALLP